ncbi:hypothetical protein MGLY_00020 [Neomoorella glycerini]|uniref:Uncharacterized protein n=1 Tax=Neomoorella glycerini TaxID=55779 RepID=A0A6I5ZLG1_9FIRM|nr:hypothetical protein [Moorella glycerini]QGP90694.1 hypothetical protein MGLY_00020 [Moorella glycerini]
MVKIRLLNNRVGSLEQGQEKMNSRLDNLEGRMVSLEKGQEQINARLGILEKDVARIKKITRNTINSSARTLHA